MSSFNPSHSKLLDLNSYLSEDEAFYRELDQKARLSLADKINRKWKKSLEELLVPSLLPAMFDKIEVSTADGLLRKSSFFSGQEILSEADKFKKIKSLLETLAILLHDTKQV